MSFLFEERTSDSPYVERIWRTQSQGSFLFTSMAISYWFMALWTHHGQTHIALHGPKTYPLSALVPEYADFLGIVFKHGTYIPQFLASKLVNDEVELPFTSYHKFWLNNRVWQFPTFENVDTFVKHLIQQDTLTHEPVVTAALYHQQFDISLRSLQRRVLKITGLSANTIYQIERAREAVIRLQQGTTILDTAFQLGYADQPHLNRSLKQFIGLTPTQLKVKDTPEQLSFLFKTKRSQNVMLNLKRNNSQGVSHAESRVSHDQHPKWTIG